MKAYIMLAISIMAELVGTTMLKMSEGFSILLPSIGVAVGYGCSFYFFSLCLRTIPLSLAYAIWSGVGTVLTAFIGIIVWGEVVTAFKVFGILLIIGGVILLNSSKKEEETVSDVAG